MKTSTANRFICTTQTQHIHVLKETEKEERFIYNQYVLFSVLFVTKINSTYKAAINYYGTDFIKIHLQEKLMNELLNTSLCPTEQS